MQQNIPIIAANGNSTTLNELPPAAYMSVGGYLDRGKADPVHHSAHPDEPWGLNGDGHLRPDILAPRLHLQIPFVDHDNEDGNEHLSFFSGTCGASSVTAGLFGYLIWQFPDADPALIRAALEQTGTPLPGYDNRAPRINGKAAAECIRAGATTIHARSHGPIIEVTDPLVSVGSNNPVEAARALTMIYENGDTNREYFKPYLEHRSPMVRKVAVCIIGPPKTPAEREEMLRKMIADPDNGVRGMLASVLVRGADLKEIGIWGQYADNHNWTMRWALNQVISGHDEIPQLGEIHDPDLLQEKTRPFFEWLKRIAKNP